MAFKRVFGLPDFSMSVTSGDDGIKLSMRVGMTDYGMGEISLLGDEPLNIDPVKALSGLIEFWPSIAGPYASCDEATAELDLAKIIGLDRQEVTFRRDGPFVGFDKAMPKLDLGGHSVVVIECLLRLGRILSEMVAEPQLKADWQVREMETDLLPMAEDFLHCVDDHPVSFDPIKWLMAGADADLSPEVDREQVEWFAAKCGQSLEQYCLAAVWLNSRNMLANSADCSVEKPSAEDWAFDSLELPKGLPTQHDVFQLAKEASAFARVELGEWFRDAVNDRNSMARGLYVYRHWFGNEPARKQHADCHVRGRFYASLTDHPDKLGEVVATFIGRRVTCEVFASDEDVAIKLRSLAHHCVVITGEATFHAGYQKPVAIRAKGVEVDEVGQRFRRLVRTWKGKFNES